MQQRLVRGVMVAVMGPFFDAFCVIFRAPPATAGVERQFFELSSAHSCECSRAPLGLPINDYGAVDIHTLIESSEQQQQQQQQQHNNTNNNNNTNNAAAAGGDGPGAAWECSSSWTRLSSCPLRADSAGLQACRKLWCAAVAVLDKVDMPVVATTGAVLEQGGDARCVQR